MIFVTVGCAVKGNEFERLIRKVDAISAGLSEDVLIQIGTSEYIPENARWVRYLSFEESLECFRKARLVIGHCGSGTIVNALNYGKSLIVVPRRMSLSEHSDDHQEEIAKFVGRNNLAKVVYNDEDLERTIKSALEEDRVGGKPGFSQNRSNLIEGIKKSLASI